MTKVLVTGANGHLGANTVRELLVRGYETVGTVRESADLRGLDGVDIPLINMDVLDEASFVQAAKGFDVIIHHAAVFRNWAKDPQDIIKPALEGTRNLFKAARQAGVSRIVYTSSIAAIGVSKSPDHVLTTADWYDDARLPYYVAKTSSEREAWKLSEETGIPMIAFNPTEIIGPYDYRITPSTNSVLGLLNGEGTTIPGGMTYVDVRDVATLHVLAVEQGVSGKRYLLATENRTHQEWAALITELTGIQPSHVAVPRSVALLAGGLQSAISSITGNQPTYTRSMMDLIYDRYRYFDASPTYETFKYQPRMGREALEACILWLLEIDALPTEIAEQIRVHRAAMN